MHAFLNHTVLHGLKYFLMWALQTGFSSCDSHDLIVADTGYYWIMTVSISVVLCTATGRLLWEKATMCVKTCLTVTLLHGPSAVWGKNVCVKTCPPVTLGQSYSAVWKKKACVKWCMWQANRQQEFCRMGAVYVYSLINLHIFLYCIV